MKKYSVVRLVTMMVFSLIFTACGKNEAGSSLQNPDSSDMPAVTFQASVLEVREEMILVEPMEDSAKRLSVDKIYVPNKEGLEVEKGDLIEIEYDGSVAESYPAQLGNVYRIAIVKKREVPESKPPESVDPENFIEEDWTATAKDIDKIYRILYDEAAHADRTNDLETTARIVECLGKNGYVAVDSNNQVDMEGAKQVLEFCKAADSMETAELTILVIIGSDGFILYELKTKDGDKMITREFHKRNEGGQFQREDIAHYPASFWQYTEEGYLLFEGSDFSEEEFALTLSDTPEHTALRVLPLEKRCRELNRQYILPVGYNQNNLFLSDWSREDYGKLDFYDLFDIFYPYLYEQPVPYTAIDETGMETIYQIPESIFERVILTYFDIDKETLRSKTSYLPDEAAYEYRPRGVYEVQYSEIPYPEVTGYMENPDGTVTLTVNAVYPYENTSRSYSHKTVIRILEDGHFQYVSNEIGPGENPDIWWHADRLTAKEWKEQYQR